MQPSRRRRGRHNPEETSMQLTNQPNVQPADKKWFIPPLLRKLGSSVEVTMQAAFEVTQPHFPALMPADTLQLGESLGDHAVVRHLISGERCEFFLVADEIRSVHRVARVPRRATLARDSNFALQMTASADLLRDLHSAHLVKIIANGLTNERSPRPYVITERLAGRNLAVYLGRHGSLEESLAVEVGTQVAKALSVLHRTGLTNPELHPRSVMLAHIAGDHFVIKLTGFERVRRMKCAPTGAANPDVHNDVRGLGQLLIHLLTGAPAKQDVLDGAPLAGSGCEVMPDLSTLLRRLTSPDLRELPTSIEEVLQALCSIQASLEEASCVSMLRRPSAAVTRVPSRPESANPSCCDAETSGHRELSFGELALLMPTLRPVSPLATSETPWGFRLAASVVVASLVCTVGLAVSLTYPGRADASIGETLTQDEVEKEPIAQRPVTVIPYSAPIDSVEAQLEKSSQRFQWKTKYRLKTTRYKAVQPAEVTSVTGIDDTSMPIVPQDTAGTAETEVPPELLSVADSGLPASDVIVDDLWLDLMLLNTRDDRPSREDLVILGD